MTGTAGVRLDLEAPVATITIDNPPLNLLSDAVRAELLARLHVAAREGAVRVVVITGAGQRAFSAGSDIREFLHEIGPQRGAERAARELEFLKEIASWPKPTVAAIEGHCLGGGCELAMACDFRVGSEAAQLGFPEIKIGLFPINAVERSVLLLGEAKTKELMFLGEPIGATEAARIGLLHRVVPRGHALAVAQDMAQQLARLPGVALAELKALANRRHLAALEEAARLVRDATTRVFATEDIQEGVAAFLEKRTPEFRHR